MGFLEDWRRVQGTQAPVEVRDEPLGFVADYRRLNARKQPPAEPQDALPPSPATAIQDAPMPERPETIVSQFDWLRQGKRPAVMITPGESMPAGVDIAGLAVEDTPRGRFFYDPQRIAPETIRTAVTEDRIGDVLGYGVPRKSPPQPGSAIVTVKGADNIEKQSVFAATPKEVSAAIVAAMPKLDPGDKIEIGNGEDIIAQRRSAAPATPAFQPEPEAIVPKYAMTNETLGFIDDYRRMQEKERVEQLPTPVRPDIGGLKPQTPEEFAEMDAGDREQYREQRKEALNAAMSFPLGSPERQQYAEMYKRILAKEQKPSPEEIQKWNIERNRLTIEHGLVKDEARFNRFLAKGAEGVARTAAAVADMTNSRLGGQLRNEFNKLAEEARQRAEIAFPKEVWLEHPYEAIFGAALFGEGGHAKETERFKAGKFEDSLTDRHFAGQEVKHLDDDIKAATRPEVKMKLYRDKEAVLNQIAKIHKPAPTRVERLIQDTAGSAGPMMEAIATGAAVGRVTPLGQLGGALANLAFWSKQGAGSMEYDAWKYKDLTKMSDEEYKAGQTLFTVGGLLYGGVEMATSFIPGAKFLGADPASGIAKRLIIKTLITNPIARRVAANGVAAFLRWSEQVGEEGGQRVLSDAFSSLVADGVPQKAVDYVKNAAKEMWSAAGPSAALVGGGAIPDTVSRAGRTLEAVRRVQKGRQEAVPKAPGAEAKPPAEPQPAAPAEAVPPSTQIQPTPAKTPAETIEQSWNKHGTVLIKHGVKDETIDALAQAEAKGDQNDYNQRLQAVMGDIATREGQEAADTVRVALAAKTAAQRLAGIEKAPETPRAAPAVQPAEELAETFRRAEKEVAVPTTPATEIAKPQPITPARPVEQTQPMPPQREGAPGAVLPTAPTDAISTPQATASGQALIPPKPPSDLVKNAKPGRTLFVVNQKNGTPYRTPHRAHVVQVTSDNTIKISWTPAGYSGSIVEDISTDRLMEPASIVSNRRRGQALAALGPEERKSVKAAAKELNALIENSPIFTTADDAQVWETQTTDRDRSIKRQAHIRASRQLAAELVGDPTVDMSDPREQARLLPKIKAYAASQEKQMRDADATARLKELKAQPEDVIPEEDLPDGALVWKDGEWHRVNREGAIVELQDGTTIRLERFDGVAVAGILEQGDEGYDKANQEFNAQRKRESAEKKVAPVEPEIPPSPAAAIQPISATPAQRPEAKAPEATPKPVAQQPARAEVPKPPIIEAGAPSQTKSRNERQLEIEDARIQALLGEVQFSGLDIEGEQREGEFYAEGEIPTSPGGRETDVQRLARGVAVQFNSAGLVRAFSSVEPLFDRIGQTVPTVTGAGRKSTENRGLGAATRAELERIFKKRGEQATPADFALALSKGLPEDEFYAEGTVDTRLSPENQQRINALSKRDTESTSGRVFTDRLRAVEPRWNAPSAANAAYSTMGEITRRKLEDIFGKRIVFYDDTTNAAGASDPAQPDVIFIHVRSKNPWLQVAGHELFHQMAVDEPALYATLLAELKSNLVENTTSQMMVLGKALEGGPAKAERWIIETMGDLVGENFAKPEFWTALRESNPSLWDRIIAYVQKFISQIQAQITTASMKGSPFFSDLNAAQTAIATAMRQYAERRQGGRAAAADFALALSKGLPESEFYEQGAVRFRSLRSVGDGNLLRQLMDEEYGRPEVGRLFDIVSPDWDMPDVAVTGYTAVGKRALEELEGIFKKRVIFFDGPEVAGGFLATKQPDLIFVHVRTKHPWLQIVGHELFHAMSVDAPDLAKALATELQRIVDSDPAARGALRDELKQVESAKKGRFLAERMADLVGAHFTDPEFLAMVHAQNPGLWDRVYRYIIGFIDTIRARITTDSLRVNPMFADLGATKRAIAQTLSNYAERRQKTPYSESGFFSGLQRAVEAVPIKQAMPGDQMLNKIMGLPGVKKQEIEETGLADWLKMQQENTTLVTKDMVLAFLAQNGVKIETVQRGGEGISESLRIALGADRPSTNFEWIEQSDRFERTAKRWQKNGDERQAQRFFSLAEEATRHSEGVGIESGTATKFSQYAPPGGVPGTYREVLITLPKQLDEVEAAEQYYNSFVRKGGEPEWRNLTGERMREIAATMPKESRSVPTYQSPHWSEPNVLAHMLIDERRIPLDVLERTMPELAARLKAKGKTEARALHMIEAQSDWHQLGAAKGYRDEKTPSLEWMATSRPGEIRARIGTDRGASVFAWISPEHSRYRLTMPDGDFEMLDTLPAAKDRAEVLRTSVTGGLIQPDLVPPGPFRGDAWKRLVIRKMLSEAAAGDYDLLSWSTGEDRFKKWGSQRVDWKKGTSRDTTGVRLVDVSKELFGVPPVELEYSQQVQLQKEVARRKDEIPWGPSWTVSAQEQTGGEHQGMNIEETARERGQLLETKGKTVRTKEDLRKVIESIKRGDETNVDKLTDRIWDRMQTEPEGTSLPRKEFFEFLYDKSFRQEASEIVRKMDQTVQPIVASIPISGTTSSMRVHALPITDTIHDKVSRGQVLYSESMATAFRAELQRIVEAKPKGAATTEARTLTARAIADEAQRILAGLETGTYAEDAAKLRWSKFLEQMERVQATLAPKTTAPRQREMFPEPMPQQDILFSRAERSQDARQQLIESLAAAAIAANNGQTPTTAIFDDMVAKYGQRIAPLRNDVLSLAKEMVDGGEYDIRQNVDQGELDEIDETDIPFSAATTAPSAETTPTEQPQWTATPGTGKEGSRLIAAIRSDKQGKRIGVRSIVAYLNKVLDLELRVGREQTTKKHPGHYMELYHMERARTEAGATNFHEAGHALWTFIKQTVAPSWMQGYGKMLTDLTFMPGFERASAHNRKEGFAEWVRNYIQNPAIVAPLAITAVIETELAKTAPALLDALRNSAKAFQAHLQRTDEAQKQSFDNDLAQRSIKDALMETIDGFGLWPSSYTMDRLEDKMFVATRKAVAGRRAGLELARQWRDETFKSAKRTRTAILRIPAELHDAIYGRPTGRNGIRVIDDEGKIQYLSDKSYVDIIKMIPEKMRDRARAAIQDAVALVRYEVSGGKITYPGFSTGRTPARVAATVETAMKEIPGLKEALVALKEYSDALMQVTVLSGEKTAEEAERITSKYPIYVPLYKLVGSEQQGGQGQGGGKPSAGLYRAKGAELPLMPLDEAIVERTRRTLRAYYWNQALKLLHRATVETLNNEKIPFLVRTMFGRVMVPLRLDRAKVATIKPEESDKLARLVVEALAEQGIDVDIDELNLDVSGTEIWRAKAPKAVNVVAYWEEGQQHFFQIADPNIFRIYAMGGRVSNTAVSFLGRLGQAIQQPWKEAITQFIGFFVRNLSRDPKTAMLLGPGWERYVIGSYHVIGALGRLFGFYPQFRQSTELLSRTVDAVTSEDHIKTNRAWAALSRNIHISGYSKLPLSDLIIRSAGTISNILGLPARIINMVGGMQLSALSEFLPREGAAIAEKWRGKSDAEALEAYHNVTGRFIDRSASEDVNSLLKAGGFINPTIQVTYQQMRKLFMEADPKVRAQAWGSVAVSGVWTALAWAIVQLAMDDDDDEREKLRPTQDRLRFVNFFGVKIPFPDGIPGAFDSFVFNTLDHHFGNKPLRQRKIVANELARKAASFLDIGLSDIMQPQVKALYEGVVIGRSFFLGRMIEPPWMQMVKNPADRYYATTPEFYKNLSRWISEMIGDDTKGLSPVRLQYTLRQGLNRTTDELIKLADMVAKDAPIREAADIPIVGSMFARNPTGWATQPVDEMQDIESTYSSLRKKLVEQGLLHKTESGRIDITKSHYAIQANWRQLEKMHAAFGEIKRTADAAKKAEQAENYSQAELQKQLMVTLATKALLDSEDFDTVVSAVKETADIFRQEKE